MAAAARKEYTEEIEQQQLEVQNMVLSGLEQINEGRIKDFNEVCDRLEKKYRNASIHS